MSGFVAADKAAADWVGCLVLTVAPRSHMVLVAEAVLEAERTIFTDPVLVDMARVAAASTPDLLGDDLDDVALRLHEELVAWAQSPARNPAPRVTFCVLVAHPDVAEADRLVRTLATTGALSELPIVFRVGGLRPTPDSPGMAIADEKDDVTRMILDAAKATAHEVDRTPDFCLTADQLVGIVAGRPSGLSRVSTSSAASVPSGASVPSPASTPEPEPATSKIGPAGTRPTHDSRRSTPVRGIAASPGSLLRRLGLPRPRTRPRRKSLPRNNVEVINRLSERSRRVSMLYLVLVSEPVRPPRQSRMLRIEVSRSLAGALMLGHDYGRERWYVRAFTAGRELRAGSPLPGPELLRHKDLPQHWGEHFDLYDGVGDIIDSIRRDTSSFVRRGLPPPRTMVVFLAGRAPSGGADSARRLSDLCRVAETVWVSFDGTATVADDFISLGVHFMLNHEDLVNELLDVIANRPALPDSADALAEPEPDALSAVSTQTEI